MQCLSFLNKKVTREKNFENTSKCEKLRDFYDVTHICEELVSVAMILCAIIIAIRKI